MSCCSLCATDVLFIFVFHGVVSYVQIVICYLFFVCFKRTNQHDVQELNRILFSALEHSLVGTSGSTFIHRLYHGTIVNSIVCKKCGTASQRQVCPRLVQTLLDWSEKVLFKANSVYLAPGAFFLFTFCVYVDCRRTSWTWQCVFVACRVWRRLYGTCLWRRSCLRGIICITVLSVTDWSLLLRSVAPFSSYFHSNKRFIQQMVTKSVFLCVTFQSAKLKQLPPFMTMSLLRFSFDFVKLERYKETGRYSFPLTINLRPFCEQVCSCFLTHSGLLMGPQTFTQFKISWNLRFSSRRPMERTLISPTSCSLWLFIREAATEAITMFTLEILINLANGIRR